MFSGTRSLSVLQDEVVVLVVESARGQGNGTPDLIPVSRGLCAGMVRS